MTQPQYDFTSNWFAAGEQLWPNLKPYLPDNKKFLEIGSYEGRSTVWTIENLMGDLGVLYAVDTWEGSEEHTDEQKSGIEDRFDANIKKCLEANKGKSVRKYKGTSLEVLPEFHALTNTHYAAFDFIYIDGSHVARDVLTDAILVWPLLKPKGVMVFDDYLWGEPRDILHRPKVAIDAFVNVFAEEVEPLHSGYQFVVRKK